MINTRLIDNDSCQIAIYETGPEADQYILFLHGNSEGASIFKNQFNSTLAKQFHLIALDFPGHGKSSYATDPEKIYRIPYLIELTGKIIQDINKPVIIAGSSLGGHVALEVSQNKPKLVKGLFLDGTPPLRAASDFEKAFIPNTATGCLFKEEINEDEMKQLSEACFYNSGHHKLFEDLIRNADPRLRSVLFASLLNNEMQDEVAIAENGTTPIALLHGEADKIINANYYKNIAFSNLWRNQTHLVPAAAHLPCLENPVLYNDLLFHFAKEIWQNN